MKAIILVAGYATRLYPLTKDRPKALLLLDGRPIIDYIVDGVNEIPSVDEILVVSNDKFYTHFSDWAKDKKNPVPIKVLNDGTTNEDNRRGAIGDIQYTIETEKIHEDVIIIAGDNYFTYSLVDGYENYKKTDKDCVYVKKISANEDITQFAVVVMDENHKIMDLEEKPQHPKSDIAAFATYIYKQDTIPMFKEYLESGNKPDAPGYFLQWLYTRKDVLGYQMQGECYDIGTLKSYEEVQEIIKNNK